MPVLVTGAAGFIGSHLVDRLLANGHEVIGADNLCRGNRANLAVALRDSRFQLVEVDLADEDAADRALGPVLAARGGAVNTVWHMAANSDIAAGVADPRVDLRDTFLTSFNTLGLMRRYGIAGIAFASSSAVYGESDTPLSEDHGPLLPISSYGAMKLASEGAISAALQPPVERAAIFRFPNVVGPRATHGVIYDLVGKLRLRGDELEVLGDGKQCKPYLHVSELIEAMMFIWNNAEEPVALYNIGPEDSGAEVAFIADAVIEATGTAARIRYTGGARGWAGDVPNFSYDVSKLSRLGWRPRHSSRDAIRRAVAEIVAESKTR